MTAGYAGIARSWLGLIPPWGLILSFGLTLLGGTRAAEAQSAWLHATEPAASLVGPGSVDEYFVETNAAVALARAETLELELPDGRFVARRIGGRLRAEGFWWRGRVDSSWEVSITGHDGALAGLIRTPHLDYELLSDADGRLRVAHVDPDLFPGCGVADAPLGPPTARPPPAAPTASADPDDPIYLDVLVVYTPAARVAAGGRAEIEATIQAAVDITNTAYINSEVDVRLYLTHVAETSFDDSGSASTDLTRVRTSTTVAALRNLHGADLVGLIANRNGACGLGYLQRRVSSSFEAFAFQVTARGCAVGNLSFAHEFGHNQGCEHDPANGNAPSSASFPFSFGHFHSGAYRTVMSYSNQCTGGCRRAPYVSNPDVTHQGRATGIVDQRDNHRTIGLTAPTVAAFRPSASTVELDRATVSVSETSTAVSLRVVRAGLISRPGTVRYTTSAGSASADVDFGTVTGTLSWSAGDATSRTISIPIFDDQAVEGPETFDLTLSHAFAVGLGPSTITRITVEDVEPGVVRLSATEFDVLENAGSVDVVIERVDGDTGPISVQLSTFAGSAEADRDYAPLTTTVDWPAGDARPRTVSVPILDDRLEEGRESFGVTLLAPTADARLGDPDTATIHIEDWEEGTFTFTAAGASAREDEASVELVVARTFGSDGEASIDVVGVGVEATAGIDFSLPRRRLSFPPGFTGPATVAVAVLDDDLVEGDERFRLQLAAPTGGAVVGPTATATVTIVDWQSGFVQLEAEAIDAAENQAFVEVIVHRVGGADGAAQVTYRTAPGTAEAGLDFEAVTGTVAWAPGESEPRTLTIPLLDDRLTEGPEQFELRLDDVATGARLGGRTVTTIRLADFEEGTVAFEVDRVAVRETDGEAVVRVVRTGGTDGEITGRWALVGGTARVDEDFEPWTADLAFADGQSEAEELSIPILDDDLPEETESILVRLTEIDQRVIVTQGEIEVRIEDAGGGRFELGPGLGPLVEGGLPLTLELVRRGETQGAVTVRYRAKSGTAVEGVDFAPAAGELTWLDGQSGSRSIELAALADELRDPGETFTLELESDALGVFLPPRPQLLIEDVEPEGCGCTAAPRGERGGAGGLGLACALLGLTVGIRRRRARGPTTDRPG